MSYYNTVFIIQKVVKLFKKATVTCHVIEFRKNFPNRIVKCFKKIVYVLICRCP